MEQVIYKSVNSSKAGLVQVQRQVNKNGKTFTQHFWIKPGDVQATDVVLSKQPDQQIKAKQATNSQSITPKKQLIQILAAYGRDAVLNYAKQAGITWKKNDHEGINWMRASMAIQKDIQANPSRWNPNNIKINSKQHSDQSSKPVNKPVNKPVGSSDSQTDNKPLKTQQNTSSIDTKKKIQELISIFGNRDKLIQAAQESGITWKKNNHEGINWMRASMVIQKALKENPNILDKQQTTQQLNAAEKKLNATEKKVKQLENLISQIQNPTAQQVDKNTKQSEILSGITIGSKSPIEKKSFGDILEKASPENLRNYRTLGMCAEDVESEQYLSRLYDKYSFTMQGNNSVAYDPNIDADPLRNKLQGVVNKSIVGVVKSSLKNIRKRTGEFTVQQKLLEPWINPNTEFTDAEKKRISKLGGTQVGTNRRDACTETDGSHKMLHKVLDKFKLSKEYGQLAEEYDAILSEYDQLTKNSTDLQNFTNGNYKLTSSQEVQESLQLKINHLQFLIKSKQESIEDYKPNGKEYKYFTNVRGMTPSEAKKKCEDQTRLLQSLVKDYTKDLKELTQLKSQTTDIQGLVKAAKLRKKLFDPKFTDLNANLYHYKMMGGELSRQYFITKDFISEYPILSKENLDKLNSADEDSLTNLALYAGMFKPSLSKKGDAKDAIMKTYSERQAFLDAYGGVTQVSGNSSYAEDNEIKCKISKASALKTKEITDHIARDWDMKVHRRMKYKIKGVYKISGLAVEKQFEEIKKANEKNQNLNTVPNMPKNQTSDYFYHGTGSMATSLILGHSGQFKLVKAKVGRMLGNGIYLADKSSKSAQYIGDEGYSRSGIHGSLMIVEASLGNTVGRNRRGSWDMNDTVFAGTQHGVLNNEWCVHNPKAVIPRYLVEMEIL